MYHHRTRRAVSVENKKAESHSHHAIVSLHSYKVLQQMFSSLTISKPRSHAVKPYVVAEYPDGSRFVLRYNNVIQPIREVGAGLVCERL